MKFRLLCFAAAWTVIGCAPRATVQKNPPGSPTPAPTPLIHSSVDVHTAVSEEDYRAAAAQAGNEDVSAQNTASYYVIAQYQYNHSDLNNALKNYQKITARSNGREEKAQCMVGQIYYDRKEYLPALAAFQTLMTKYPDSAYADQCGQMTEFVVNYFLNLEDLRSFVKNYPNSSSKCSALFQLGNHEVQSSFSSDASAHLTQFLKECPKHPSAQSAQLLLQSLQTQPGTKTWRIGVLIPSTGRYKAFGESVLHGITLAVEQADQAGTTHKSITLVVRDTMGDPIKAAKVFQDLTADNTLDAIIGPVLPSEIGVIASLANERKIALLCPSDPRDGLSTLGPYLFSNSLTNEMQGRAMAKYAIEHLGLRRFGVLAPDDTDSNSYGNTLAQSFGDTVKSMGGTVVSSETYESNSTDFKEQLVAMGGQDPTAAKEGDRENKRRMEELEYAIDKEVKKILIKSKNLTGILSPTPVVVEALASTASAVSSPTATPVPPAMAFVSVPEALGNTTAPSVVKDINELIKSSLKEGKELPLRSDDLVQQALTRLPKGNSFPVSVEQLVDVAQDIQASLVITAQVLGTNPAVDSNTHLTWDYVIQFQAMQFDTVKKKFVKIYQNRIFYSTFKPYSPLQKNDFIQALYLPAHSAVEIPQLASQVHFFGLNPVLLGGHLWMNESVRQEGSKDVEGSFFVAGYYVDSQQGNPKRFAEEYLRRFLKRPDMLAAQAYDAANLMLKATLASTNRDDIHDKLMGIVNFDGVTGTTTFGGHGEPEKQVPILKIQNGRLEQVQ